MGLDNENIKGADAIIAKLQQAEHYLQTQVKEVVGTEAVKQFKQNFETESFDGNKWASRKTKVKLQRKILTGQGSGDHLSDSIDYKIEGQTVVIYTDKPYAQIHNEGGVIAVTEQMKKFFWSQMYKAKEDGDVDLQDAYKAMALSKEIKIQQRQFMGESQQLYNNITNKIVRDLEKILK